MSGLAPRGVLELTIDDDKCKCEKPECNKWEKDECYKKGGKYDDDKCKCTYPPKCDDWKKKECEWKKGKFDDHSCKCTYPEPPKCDDWKKKECEWKKGKFDDHSCKCTYPEPQHPPKGDHFPWDVKDKCSKKGGSCSESRPPDLRDLS